MTRTGDYDLASINKDMRKRSDLANRAKLINDSNCDLYLSIHLNSDVSDVWSGAQIFYDKRNDKNKEIANILQEYFVKNLHSKREAKNKNDYYMYQRITRPGVLVEAGFLSNPNERYLLKQKNYQTKISKTITEAIIDYYN